MANLALVFDIIGRDKASKEFDKVGKAAEGAGKKADSAGKLMGGISGGMKAGLAGIVAGIAGAGLADLFGGLAADARESAKVGAITNQIIKATGGAAKLSASQIGELSTAISNKTGVDDEAIQTGANMLLTFKNIKNETGSGAKVFDRATQAAVDLSKAGFGSIEGASVMLGKALNDPVKGMTALGKSGVTFTDQQKEQVKALMKSGDILGAQKIILGEVEGQVGGVAAASATMDEKYQTAIGNMREGIGTALLPVMDKLQGFIVEKVLPAINGLVSFTTEKFVPAFQGLWDLIIGGDFTGALRSIFGWEEDSSTVDTIMNVRQSFVDALRSVKEFGTTLKQWWTQYIQPTLAAIWQIIVNDIAPVFKRYITDTVIPIMKDFGAKVMEFWAVAKPIFEWLWQVIRDDVAPTISWLWTNIIGPVFTKAGSLIRTVWFSIISPALSALATFIGKVLFPVIKALYESVIKPTMQNIGAIIKWAWDTVISPTFDLWELAFKAIGIAGSFMWNTVLKPVFIFIAKAFLTLVGGIVSGAATAFGWVPGLGPKLRDAATKFDTFKTDVNKALDHIDDEPVTVSVGFKYGGPTTSKYKVPLYSMQAAADGLGLDSYGRGIGDGPGLDVKTKFPAMSKVSSMARDTAMADGTAQLMALLEDSGGGLAPSGATGWKAMWAAVKKAIPGATLNSAFRAGAITATGNRSYHSMGRAIDIGPATMATFRAVKALFPKATELIFSPAGREQLWHGQPHMYSGVTRANHWDHVHLAMQNGGLVPGIGRGDKVPALLEPGEYVVSRPAAQANKGALDAMNNGGGGGVTNIFNGDVYDASLIERQRREAQREQRAASFRAGVAFA